MAGQKKKTGWQRLVRIGAVLGVLAGGLLLCLFILALLGPTIGRLVDPEFLDEESNNNFCQEALAGAGTLGGEALQTFDLPAAHPVVTPDNVGEMAEVTAFETVDPLFSQAMRLEDGTVQIVRNPNWPGIETALSPDGTLLIAIEGRASYSALIRACAAESGEAIKTWSTDETTRAVSFTPDGSRFILNEGRGTLLVYDTETLRRSDRWDVRAGKQWRVTHFAAMHPAGMLVAFTADHDGPGGDVRLWDVAEGKQVGVLPGHPDSVIDMQWSEDGSLLLTTGFDGVLRVWAVLK